ncbi:MAG: hypothetical protein K2L78_06925, partial [Muribaculaceae bacterium]|nr:hypothetical protein [Muribaculaceae bacterium]
MKRLYTVFLTAVVALVCSVAASAQNGPLNLTLNCDRDDAIEWRQTWSDADWKLLQKGDNAIVLDYDYGYNLHLRPVDGMRLDAVKSIDPDTYSDLEVYNPLDRSSFYPNSSWEGRTYNLVTTDLSEVRTTKLTVNITDDPKRFTIRRNSGPAYTFPSAGEHEFALDPNAELPLYVVAAGGTPLYKVELDDAAIPLDVNSRTNYTINNVTDGSRLDITANWPDDLETDVKITVPAEMAENLVRNFGRQVGYSTEYLDYQVNESFKVKSGYFYNLYFNTSEYSITSIKVNGVDQYVSSSTSFFAGTDPIEVVVEAIVKEVPKYTLRVARAGEVLYSTNGYSFGPLPEGDTEISP